MAEPTYVNVEPSPRGYVVRLISPREMLWVATHLNHQLEVASSNGLLTYQRTEGGFVIQLTAEFTAQLAPSKRVGDVRQALESWLEEQISHQ